MLLPSSLSFLKLPTCVLSPFSLPPKLWGGGEISTRSMAGMPNAQRQAALQEG